MADAGSSYHLRRSCVDRLTLPGNKGIGQSCKLVLDQFLGNLCSTRNCFVMLGLRGSCPWALCPPVADRGNASPLLGHGTSWCCGMTGTGFRVRKPVSPVASLPPLATRALANLCPVRPGPCRSGLDRCSSLPVCLTPKAINHTVFQSVLVILHIKTPGVPGARAET